MTGFVAYGCCLLTEPYSLDHSGRREDGLNFLLRVRGKDTEPMAVSHPYDTAGEAAKKCLGLGIPIGKVAKLIPPKHTMEELRQHVLKETQYGG